MFMTSLITITDWINRSNKTVFQHTRHAENQSLQVQEISFEVAAPLCHHQAMVFVQTQK
jgi:hypothetical protein